MMSEVVTQKPVTKDEAATWPMVALGDVATINPRLPGDSDETQIVSFVSMASASEEGFLLDEEPRILSEAKKGFTYFERSDVLVAKITPCFENGKCLRPNMISNQIGFGSTEFHVLRANEDRIDKTYLFYAIWNDKFRYLGQASMSGAAGQKRISSNFLKQHKIPLPPLPEQKRIAAILDKADSIRRKRQQATALADEFLRSVFLDMFGDPVANTKGWEVRPLIELGDVITGKTPPSRLQGMWNGEIPFVTPGDLTGIIYRTNRTITNEGAEKSRVCRSGALLVCCIGATIGKAGISRREASFNQQINAVEWNDEIVDEYGYYVFKLFPSVVVKNAIQTTLPILKKTLFENIVISVPPKSEQLRFVSICKSTMCQIEKYHNEDYDSILGSVSQKAFVGHL